jgi:hypothetical protein
MPSNSMPDNKRLSVDRRMRKIPPLKYLLFGGRRTGARRQRDKKGLVWGDTYDPKILIIILSIITLSLVDGFFTLFLIGHGASEVNPIMNYFLDLNPWAFMFAKFVFTCSGLICMLVLSHTDFKPLNLRVRSIFSIILVAFLIVIIWQIYLKFNHII